MMNSLNECPSCGEVVTRLMQRCPHCHSVLRGGVEQPVEMTGLQTWQLLVELMLAGPCRDRDKESTRQAVRARRWSRVRTSR